MEDSNPGNCEDFLVVRICNQLFALPAADVSQALSPPGVTPLPFVPDFVLGLISVNDKILPLLDLSGLIANDQATPTDKRETDSRNSRPELVVINTGRSRCALHCQKIISSVSVNRDAITTGSDADMPSSAALTTLALSSGQFDIDGQSVRILDSTRIGHLISPRHMTPGEPGMIGHEDEDMVGVAEQEQCLIFVVGDEHFALRLEDVVEILELPLSESAAGAPEEMEGLQLVRGELLPVLALGKILGVNAPVWQQSPVIVIARNARHYGLRVNRVIGLHSYEASDIRMVQGGSTDAETVLVGDDNAIALLSPSRLISTNSLTLLAPFVPLSATSQHNIHAEETEKDRQSVLTARLANHWLGFPLNIVMRISGLCEFEEVKTRNNPLIKGVLSLDGRIVPVLDSRVLLGQREASPDPAPEHAANGAWIVIGNEQRSWALAVNEAHEIIDIPGSQIRPVEDSQARFICALANIEGKLLSLIGLGSLERAA